MTVAAECGPMAMHNALKTITRRKETFVMNTPFENLPLAIRAYNLGLKAVPNFVNLTENQILYYETHLSELRKAVNRGFILPDHPQSTGRIASAIAAAGPYQAADTDLDHWLDWAQEFAAKHLETVIDLRKSFMIPATLPWRSAIPVFDPGWMSSALAIKRALIDLGQTVSAQENVMEYNGSGPAGKPTLCLIENSIQPNIESMGKSPKDLCQSGLLYLRLRGYVLAFSLFHFTTSTNLDEKSWT